MPTSILATKLYVPHTRSTIVARPRLIERLNKGLYHRLTLISAPAGFGKTTLLSEWVEGCDRPTAWLSLDEEDSDLIRFLTYLITALQTVAAVSYTHLSLRVLERKTGLPNGKNSPTLAGKHRRADRSQQIKAIMQPDQSRRGDIPSRTEQTDRADSWARIIMDARLQWKGADEFRIPEAKIHWRNNPQQPWLYVLGHPFLL